MFKRLGLFHRIFLHGILLILALGVAVVVTFHATGVETREHPALQRAVGLLAKSIAPAGADQSSLREQLEAFCHITQAGVVVYAKDGTLLAKAGDRHPDPFSETEIAALFEDEKPHHRRFGEMALPIRDAVQPAYVIIDWHEERTVAWRFLTGLAVALLVIGLMSVPLARSIARPLKSITHTARALEGGDLSARVTVEANDELGMLATTMNDMADALEARILREKELLANVSHELRTPLARMRVALEIAAESEDPARVHEHLEGITGDIAELEQLVSDILATCRLDLSARGEGHELPIKLEPARLADIVTDAAARFERRNKVEVEVAVPRDAPCLPLDSALMRRVIDNLLSNGAAYSQGPPSLSVSMVAQPESQSVAVKDRGTGVPPDQLGRIFEPFYRTDKSRDKNAGGLGLGLTLCQRVVEAHGGTITARNREGGGLEVTITLQVVAS
jgi:signal transduction histidine kinase